MAVHASYEPVGNRILFASVKPMQILIEILLGKTGVSVVILLCVGGVIVAQEANVIVCVSVHLSRRYVPVGLQEELDLRAVRASRIVRNIASVTIRACHPGIRSPRAYELAHAVEIW